MRPIALAGGNHHRGGHHEEDIYILQVYKEPNVFRAKIVVIHGVKQRSETRGRSEVWGQAAAVRKETVGKVAYNDKLSSPGLSDVYKNNKKNKKASKHRQVRCCKANCYSGPNPGLVFFGYDSGPDFVKRKKKSEHLE